MLKKAAAVLAALLSLSLACLAEDLLVPLDDRPANLLFVQQVARIGQPQQALAVTPRHLLGGLLRPGDCQAIANWTLQQAQAGDTVIVCTDMWLYGGLVASRSAATSEAELESRLEALRALCAKGVKVHAIATIPRLSLRTSDAQAPHERTLANWAAKADLPGAQAMLDSPDNSAFPSGVPPELVREYLGVRVRNTNALLRLVAMAPQFESLVLGQDDSHKTGIHVVEHEALRERIAVSPVADRITLVSGIDELSMSLVAGVLARRAGYLPTVRVVYSDPQAAEKIPPLESLPLGQMVREHLALSGARPVDDESAEVDLFVYAPYEKPYALPGEEKRPQSEAFVQSVREAMARGRRVAVADLSLVNRMDPFLAEAVLRDVSLPELQGFASWNTPANTVGTVIAQLVCHRLAETSRWKLHDRLESEKTHQAFLLARMVDDYVYQTVVRDAVKPQIEGLSAPRQPLLNVFGPVGIDIRLRLIEWVNNLFATHYQDRTICLLPQRRLVSFRDCRLRVVLPWPRTFEVEARLDLRLQDTGQSCPTEKPARR